MQTLRGFILIDKYRDKGDILFFLLMGILGHIVLTCCLESAACDVLVRQIIVQMNWIYCLSLEDVSALLS